VLLKGFLVRKPLTVPVWIGSSSARWLVGRPRKRFSRAIGIMLPIEVLMGVFVLRKFLRWRCIGPADSAA